MAVYKVPQDVEAEDKLLGPFSFRQFIYLIIAVMGVALGWGLSRIFFPLAIIPLPIVLLFGVLALPLRKDQPMEVYLAALISFYLKPRRRFWKADGVQTLVEIVAPKVVEEHLTKDLSQEEAEKRFAYLATLADSRGWSVRGVDMPQAETPMQADAFFEAQQAEDMLDDTSDIAHVFDGIIGTADEKRRQAAISLIHQLSPAAAQIPPIPDPYAALSTSNQGAMTPPSLPSVSTAQPNSDIALSFNPYPSAMRQSVINPHPAAQPQEMQSQPVPGDTSHLQVSPDIINLANNTDLSIETMAHEAQRIREKEAEPRSEGEVVIPLR